MKRNSLFAVLVVLAMLGSLAVSCVAPTPAPAGAAPAPEGEAPAPAEPAGDYN